MTNEFSPQDEQIIKRLKEMSNSSASYPVNSLKKRRKSFLKETSGLVLGLPVPGFLKSRLSFLTQASVKNLEFILVGVLLAEAGLSAYIFRDQIRDWFMTETSTPMILQSTWAPQPTNTETPPPTTTATATFYNFNPTSKTPSTDQGLHIGQTKTPKP